MKIFKNHSFSQVFSIISSVPPCSFCARILHFLFKNTIFGSLIVGCVWDYIFDRPNPPKSRPEAAKSSPRASKRSSKVHSELTRRLLGLQNRPFGPQNRHLGLQNHYLGLRNRFFCLPRSMFNRFWSPTSIFERFGVDF